MKVRRAIAALAVVVLAASGMEGVSAMEGTATEYQRRLASSAASLPDAPQLAPGDWLLIVTLDDQRLIACRDGEIRAVYPVSTAANGAGSLENSGKTPLGWHRVCEWIGGREPLGRPFVSRKPSGKALPPAKWREKSSADMVLTRILWLDGLEPGRNKGGNVDSHDRFIYIHGTNQEQLLGTPASHGCIRLSNRAVAELFDLTLGSTTYCLVLQ